MRARSGPHANISHEQQHSHAHTCADAHTHNLPHAGAHTRPHLHTPHSHTGCTRNPALAHNHYAHRPTVAHTRTASPGVLAPHPSLHRDWAHPWPHLHWDWAHAWPHLHRDWAHRIIGAVLQLEAMAARHLPMESADQSPRVRRSPGWPQRLQGVGFNIGSRCACVRACEYVFVARAQQHAHTTAVHVLSDSTVRPPLPRQSRIRWILYRLQCSGAGSEDYVWFNTIHRLSRCTLPRFMATSTSSRGY